MSHGLLPSFCLVGRLDALEVIGDAVAAVAGGVGVAKAAEGVDVPYTTVRGWWRRHRERGAVLLAASGAGLEVAEIDARLKVAAGAAGCSAVSVTSAGRWLSTNMDPPLAGGPGWDLMVTMAHVARRPP